MKKIIVILLGVLFCTHVFANGKIELKKTTGSSSAVVKSAGSKIVKLFYKSESVGTVEVSISNSNGQLVFKENVSGTKGFVRPYNFESLPEGEYTITLVDTYGKMVEKVVHANLNIQKLIDVRKLPDADKYLLTIASKNKDKVTLIISDGDDNPVYQETITVEGEFGKVYNVKNLKKFSIDLIDSNGILKNVKY